MLPPADMLRYSPATYPAILSAGLVISLPVCKSIDLACVLAQVRLTDCNRQDEAADLNLQAIHKRQTILYEIY